MNAALSAAPRCAWLLVLLAALPHFCVLSLANGQEANPPRQATAKILWSGSRSFQIPVTLNSREGRSRIREIVLFASEDLGVTWKKVARTTPDSPLFPFRAARDAEYWFAVSTYTSDGKQYPKDEAERQADLRVIVDATKPTILLEPSQRRGSEAAVRWEVQDAHLLLRTLTLEYQVEGAITWRQVPLTAADQKLIGVKAWDAGSPDTLKVRMSVGDRAGNVQTAELVLPDGLAAAPVPVARGAAASPPPPAAPAATASPSIRLDPPRMGTGMQAGKILLTWESRNLALRTRPISLYYRAEGPDSPWIPIAEDVDNTGRYIWTPPPTVPTRLHVRISATDAQGRRYEDDTTGIGPLLLSRDRIRGRIVGLDDVFGLGRDVPRSPPRTDQVDVPPGLRAARPRPPGTPRQGFLVGSPSFDLKFEVENAGPDGPEVVRPWATPDNGRTWFALPEDPDRVSPCRINLGGDGVYGLWLEVRRGASGDPAPSPGDRPTVTVEVDSTPPIVRLDPPRVGVGAEAGKVSLSWRTTEANPVPRPISIWYRDASSVPEWVPLLQGVADTPPLEWTVPKGAPASLDLRVEMMDALGNRGSGDTTASGPIRVPLADRKPEGSAAVGVMAADGLAGSAPTAPGPDAGRDVPVPPGIGRFQVLAPRLSIGSLPSDAGFKWLADHGYRTVLDLRPGGASRQEVAAIKARGLAYRALPLSARTLDAGSLDQFAALISDESARPLFAFDETGMAPRYLSEILEARAGGPGSRWGGAQLAEVFPSDPDLDAAAATLSRSARQEVASRAPAARSPWPRPSPLGGAFVVVSLLLSILAWRDGGRSADVNGAMD